MNKNSLFVILPCLISVSFGALNRDGVVGINKTFSAQTLHHGKLGIGVQTQIIDDQLEVEKGEINRSSEVAPNVLTDFLTLSSSVFLSLGLGPYTDIGLALPIYYEKFKSDIPGFDLDHQYQGDLRYRLKFQLPLQDLQVVSLAILLGGTAPTQFDERGVIPRELEYMTNDAATFGEGSSPFGAGRPSFLAALGLTLDLGQVAEEFQFLWHFNLGVRKINISKQPPFDDILFWSTAAEYEAGSFIRFFSEFLHESRFNKLGDNEFASEPTTLTFGGLAQTPVGLDFYAGLVMGFNTAYIPVEYNYEGGTPRHNFSIKSSPDLSMLFGISWAGFILKQDNDLDGIMNKVDHCPDAAEDKDGFQDDDGCPDPDNDKDGVADIKDKCPIDPEDKDSFEDDDGCPDPDNDKDGVLDLLDKCPMIAQGLDGKEGCPNLDKDKDGILDAVDKCITEAEDKDNFEDEDGCPEADNDKDGIADAQDKCQNAPETINGFDDKDGCPDNIQVKEVVKTMVLKGVNFKTNSAELMAESYRVLDEIVPQIQGNLEITFEIAGHTDNRGNATKNQMLSQTRAQSVANYFIQKGVDSKRLKVMGYGSSRPLSPNTSAEGRALNRRVELNRVN
jgi:outer membrane protein OmpA-like peptidoglycan-associated protein